MRIKEEGITVIALIITIVVLLILAVVAIRAVQGDGIIAYAQNAATGYNQAQKEEGDMLQAYLNIMDDAQNQINNATKPNESEDGVSQEIKNIANIIKTKFSTVYQEIINCSTASDSFLDFQTTDGSVTTAAEAQKWIDAVIYINPNYYPSYTGGYLPQICFYDGWNCYAELNENGNYVVYGFHQA